MPPPAIVTQREEHAERFDHHHDHHDAHRDDWHEMELRQAEAEGDDDVAPGRSGNLLKMHHAQNAGEHGAGDDTEQNRDVGDEARAPFDQAEDNQQHEGGDAEPL